MGTGDFNGIYVSGDSFGIFGWNGIVYLPKGYVSNAPIAGQSFFEGASLATMGFLIGDSFEWVWGSGATEDRVVLEVLAPIPEPGTTALLTAAAAALLAVGVRRYRAKAQV